MDFVREFAKYDFIKVDNDLFVLSEPNNEVSLLIDAFNSNIKRISKEQNKMNMAIEEIIDLMELNNQLQEKSLAYETKNKSMQKIISDIMGKIEDTYKFDSPSLDEAYKTQLSVVWESLKEYVSTVGVNVIDRTLIPYNFSIHTIVEVISNNNYPDNYVVEILKCGFAFADGEVLKAKVIVNKIEM